MKKNKIWYSIILALVVLVVLYQFVEPKVAEDIHFTHDQMIKNFKVPDNLSFANERVPLERPEVYRKMDREIQVNAYWHSNAIVLIKRANQWLPVIDSILKANDIPSDFKYMAVAESGLQNVVSPSNATGFWQFLKPTAIDMGLIVNDEIDQRYDPYLSTIAAAKYLKWSKQQFDSWTEVVVSYNMGVNATKSVKKNQASQNYYDMYISEEPSRYVFRIIALKNLLENPSEYGFEIGTDDNYVIPKTKEVDLTHSITDLSNFAAQNGTTVFVLKTLNPWIRKHRLTLKKGQKLKIKLPIQ